LPASTSGRRPSARGRACAGRTQLAQQLNRLRLAEKGDNRLGRCHPNLVHGCKLLDSGRLQLFDRPERVCQDLARVFADMTNAEGKD